MSINVLDITKLSYQDGIVAPEYDIYSTEIYKKNQSGLCVCALYYIDDTNQLLSWLLVETMVTSDNKFYSIFYEKHLSDICDI
jgi:hypothetical protein